MTPAESRNAIVGYLVARTEWIPVAELVEYLRGLGLSDGQGRSDLRVLVKTGRIERADDVGTKNGFGGEWASKYRASLPARD